MRIASLPKEKLWFDYANYKPQPRFLNLSDEEKAIIEQFKNDGCYLYKNAISDDVLARSIFPKVECRYQSKDSKQCH